MKIRRPPDVPLTPEFEVLLGSKVASGRYRSASEAVRAALRGLDDRESRTERRLQPAEEFPDDR